MAIVWNCAIKVYWTFVACYCNLIHLTSFFLSTIKQSRQPGITFQSVFTKGCKQTTRNVSTKKVITYWYFHILLIHLNTAWKCKDFCLIPIVSVIVVSYSPTTPNSEMLRVTVTSSETDEKNATFKVVTKVRVKEGNQVTSFWCPVLFYIFFKHLMSRAKHSPRKIPSHLIFQLNKFNRIQRTQSSNCMLVALCLSCGKMRKLLVSGLLINNKGAIQHHSLKRANRFTLQQSSHLEEMFVSRHFYSCVLATEEVKNVQNY